MKDLKYYKDNAKKDYPNTPFSVLQYISALEAQKRFTGIKDKNGSPIYFGDRLRFVDKYEWYGREYWAKIAFGTMTKKEAREEINKRPYEERVVESEGDYEWLLSSEIQIYWEKI